MVSLDKAHAPRVGVSLTEDSVICETGGGFTRTEWSVQVNDGWLSVFHVVGRRRIGEIASEVEDEEDPYGVASGGQWFDRPPQVWYRRVTYIVAPVGTRFRRRVWTPVRDPRKGVWFSSSEDEFELRGDGRLVRPHVLAERAARKDRQVAQPDKPLPKSEALQHLGALLSQLGDGPPAEPMPVDSPSATPQPTPRRRRPAERWPLPAQTGRKIA